MENGMYAAVKNENTICAVYIDQDNLELGRLNQRMRCNRRKAEQSFFEAEAMKAERTASEERAQKIDHARRRKNRRILWRMIKQELSLAATMAVVSHGLLAGLISEIFAIPVLAILLAVACFKAGSFFTRIFWRRR